MLRLKVSRYATTTRSPWCTVAVYTGTASFVYHTKIGILTQLKRFLNCTRQQTIVEGSRVNMGIKEFTLLLHQETKMYYQNWRVLRVKMGRETTK
jgi:hypothetical protein